MSKFSGLARSSALMTAGTLTSRILGFVKAAMLTVAIGVTVGGAADAFDVANKVPNNLYMLLAGGVLNAVLVPQIVRAQTRADGGRDFTNRLLTLAIILLLIVTVASTAAAALLVRVYASSSWPPEQLALATAFAYWCLPQVFFYGLYTLLGQVLNAHKSFGPYMWAPVLNNIVSIAGLAVFIAIFGSGENGENGVGTWDDAKIALLAGSATLGVVAQAVILIIPLRRLGFRFKPTFGWRGVGLRTASNVAGWTFGALLIGQLGFVAISQVSSLATSASSGEPSASNAAYTASYLVFMLPHSLAAVSIATALFTSMSEDAARNNTDGVRQGFSLGVRVVGLINMFAVALMMVLAPLTAFVLAEGSRAQADAIGWVIRAMIIGLVPYSANYLMQRVFYSYEDARTPFWIQVVQVTLTTAGVLGAALLPGPWIVAGVGLAMSVGYVVGMTLSAARLRRRIGHLDGARLLGSHAKLLVAAALAVGVGFLVLPLFDAFAWHGRLSAILTVLAVTAVMGVVYVGVAWVIRVSELRVLGATLAKRMKR